jgi:Raf kinase inhibitor-like YbhB/YbcL family protein
VLERALTRASLPVLVASCLVLLAACGGDDDGTDNASPTVSTSSTTAAPATGTTSGAGFTLTSSAFDDGEAIPRGFTCDGDNTSPPLAWSGVPADASELALIMDDPDAPSGTFVHWVVWGIDADDATVDAGTLPDGAVLGSHGAGGEGYTGPCPPSGVHHYNFQLFALSAAPDVQPGASAKELRDAIAAITVADTTLTGTYQRSQG